MDKVVAVLFILLMSLLLSSIALAQLVDEPLELRVGVYHNPPKVLAGEDGQISGIFGELLNEIAGREAWVLTPVYCDWSRCLDLLASGEIDVMPDVAISAPRSDRFAFHDTPALLSWSQIYTDTDLSPSSLLDLEGLRLAVLHGSVQESYLDQLTTALDIQLQWVQVNSLEEGFQAIMNDRADAVAANHYFGDARAHELRLRSAPIMFQPSRLFFVTRPDVHAVVLNAIDGYLEPWQQQPGSFYFNVLSRWTLTSSEGRSVPVALWWGLAALFVSLLVALIFSVLLRRQVAEKTAVIRNSESRLNTILDSVDAYIYIKDLDLRYTYANRKVANLMGRPVGRIVGHHDEEFLDRESSERLRANDLRVLEKGERVATEEVNTVSASGEERAVLSVKLPLRDLAGRIYALCGISTDITEHLETQEQLHQLAFYDPLTELPNRRLVLERLSHAIASHEITGFEGALLLVDLDNFKILNDTLGHDMGDTLLKKVAGRLSLGIRSTDTAGRLGADEFVLIIEDLNHDTDKALVQVRDMAQEVLSSMAQAFDLNGTRYVTSVSIGVALLSDAGGDVDALLKGADLALSAAKVSGRNMLRFFNPEMQIEVNRRTEIEIALRHAIDTDQIHIHLQPQFDCESRIIGMEALARWDDVNLGVVPPASFIPVAELSGLIIPLGQCILEQACRVLKDWQSIPSMSQLSVAVNISPEQFRHPGFVEHLATLMEAQQIDPALLELEVTESLLIDDMENTIARMEELRAIGVRFSLDDFGTGYASLGYLKRLPLYQLKIDQSFVRDLLTDPNDEAIVRTIIALGESLDLRVIAEGVETVGQARRLREMGCAVFQGYYYGRPGPVESWRSLDPR